MVKADESGCVAVVDLGSNSFQLMIGRLDGDELVVLDRIRDPVRMAAGIEPSGALNHEIVARVLASLERFRQRLSDIPAERVRAIGTSTFREARSPKNLLERANEALGFPIEVLSGHEEARLIYIGVTQGMARTEGSRLVIDIGGGSTECILGTGAQATHVESLDMGCVTFSKRFFLDGVLGRDNFRSAESAACLKLETLAPFFREHGWSECVGSSGTINAVADVLCESESGATELTPAKLDQLRSKIIDAERVDQLALRGLRTERAPVFAGGVAILCAVFESLGIQRMQRTTASIREGVLYDLLERTRN